jgi:hypothetical protein
MTTPAKPFRENAQSRPVTVNDPGDPSEVDVIHQATEAQGQASPEDYPPAEREAQVEAATGRKAPG